MALDVIGKIITPLSKSKEDLETILDDLESISQNAIYVGGDVSKVVAANLSQVIERLRDISSGTEQYSISSLIGYMRNVPLDQVMPKEVAKKISGLDASSGADAASANANLVENPDVGAVAAQAPQAAGVPEGPQSAIRQEIGESVGTGNFLDTYFGNKEAITGIHESFEEDENDFTFNEYVETTTPRPVLDSSKLDESVDSVEAQSQADMQSLCESTSWMDMAGSYSERSN